MYCLILYVISSFIFLPLYVCINRSPFSMSGLWSFSLNCFNRVQARPNPIFFPSKRCMRKIRCLRSGSSVLSSQPVPETLLYSKDSKGCLKIVVRIFVQPLFTVFVLYQQMFDVLQRPIAYRTKDTVLQIEIQVVYFFLSRK